MDYAGILQRLTTVRGQYSSQVSGCARNVAIYPHGNREPVKRIGFKNGGFYFHKDLILYSCGMAGKDAWCSPAINCVRIERSMSEIKAGQVLGVKVLGVLVG